MWPQAIVECDILADAGFRFRNAFVRVQVDFFLFKRFPEALDEDVVAPSALAVHERDAVLIANQRNKILVGELRALVGVEDLRQSRTFRSLRARRRCRSRSSTLFECRHANTRRVAQSRTAKR